MIKYGRDGGWGEGVMPVADAWRVPLMKITFMGDHSCFQFSSIQSLDLD